MNWLHAIGILVGIAVLDILWVLYTRATAAGHALAASLWAAPLYLVSTGSTLVLVTTPWLLIPGAIGAFVGTWIGFHLPKRLLIRCARCGNTKAAGGSCWQCDDA
jgi:hypothetical protein